MRRWWPGHGHDHRTAVLTTQTNSEGRAPRAYRHHRRRFARGDHGWVAANSTATLAQLDADSLLSAWGPGVEVRLGAALARRQRLVEADARLTAGLAAMADSPAGNDLKPHSQWVLQLVEVNLLRGHTTRAARLATRLWQGGGSITTRVAAARALACAHLMRGDVTGAHQWLDGAATLGGPGHGALNPSLVFADRAVVVATDGRPTEAVDMAWVALGRLDSHNNPLARSQAVVMAATVALAAAHDGDLWSACQLLDDARSRHRTTERPVTDALIDIGDAATCRLAGELTEAEAHVERAARTLAATGAEPLRATAVREQALVAAGAGQWSSAVAQATHASQLFGHLAMALEQARTDNLVVELSALADDDPRQPGSNHSEAGQQDSGQPGSGQPGIA